MVYLRKADLRLGLAEGVLGVFGVECCDIVCLVKKEGGKVVKRVVKRNSERGLEGRGW
jgi:hypothetical protein